MKKLLRTLLLAAALTALLCVSALAADSAVSNVTGNILTPKTAADAPITANADGKYENAAKFDVNATGTATSQYLLLVLRDQNVPTERNIVYINQAAAGEDGKLAFTGSDAAYPMTMTSGTYYVYLVGADKPFTANVPAASFTYEAGYTLGDVDGNGKVNINDALELLNFLAEKTVLEGNNLKAADVDKTGAVNINDALKLLNYLAEKIPTLD